MRCATDNNKFIIAHLCMFKMKWLFLSFVVALPAIMADLVCEYPKPDVPTNWIQMNQVCIGEVRKLIDYELQSATQYLAQAAFFYRTSQARAGFGEVFITSANHHRSNCKRLIDYLTMRGKNVNDINTLLQLGYTPIQTEWENAAEGFKFALRLEGEITNRYRHVIGVCEDQTLNDFNLVNWLTKEFLYTQYDDMKWYADELSSLLKTFVTNGFYAEFMMDRGYEQEYSDD